MSVGADVASPQASRLARRRWLDPRLIAGVLLVLGAVVLGTRIIAAADHTVPVLVAAADLAPGQPLTAAMVETRDVVLDGNLDLYFTGEVGSGYVVVRTVSEGELLARSAVAATTDSTPIRYVTVAVPAIEAPAGLVAGAVVDVWRTPPEQDVERAATPLLSGVTVAGAESGASGLSGAGGQARVTLAVTGDGDLDELTAGLIAAARDGLVYLTAVPEGPR